MGTPAGGRLDNISGKDKMAKFSKETIGYRKVIGSPRVLQDAEFERCEFEGGALVQYDDPTCGLIVRNVVLRRCRGGGNVEMHGVRFENVMLDGIGNRELQFWSCIFDRVTLRGRIGPIMTVQAHTSLSAETRAAFRDQAVKSYADIEWALDISEAEFSGVDFSYVPGKLVRRNPETQFLIHREAAQSAALDSLPTYVSILVERAAMSPYETTVAPVPTRSKNADRYRAQLQELRDRGIAE
jgi:hypothetical protein